LRHLLKSSALAVLLSAAAIAGGGEDDSRPLPDVPKASAALDSLLAKRLDAEKVKAAPLASDAEFVRRLYLDLTGSIPTASQALAFLDSKDPDRRKKLIDQLLDSPAYGKHFGTIWRNLIIRPDANMVRQPNTQPLVDWLAAHFNKGSGWDRIVTEMLTAEGSRPESLFFILNGDTRGYPQSNVIAGTVGQIFMGTQLACAECHNHPFVDKWKQDDFWGVAAFFGKVQNGGGAKGGKEASTSITEVTTPPKDKKRNMAPKIGPGASIVIPDTSFKQIGRVVKARFPHGEHPALKREEPFRPAFVKWLVARENPYFAANVVNRLWGHLFGRAFANPVGEVSEVNPHSHPEVVAFLSKELTDNGFDLKHLIRVICNSQAYQRSSRSASDDSQGEALFARQGVKVMTPEVLYSSLTTALEVPDLKPVRNATGAKKKGGGAGKALNPAAAREQFLAFFTTKDVEGDATEYTLGIPQALRLMNQDLFNTGGNTVARAAKLGSPDKAVEALYLAALSRRPTREESDEATAFVAKAKSKEEGYRGVFWALINSAEFILNR
jgi:hypothetical protein